MSKQEDTEMINDTFQLVATQPHLSFEVDGRLVVVRADNEQHARAALLKRFGFGAKIILLG